MGEFFDTYKKNKNPPNSYLCDNAITWCVSYGNLYDITCCASCCYESNVHDCIITGCVVC